MTDSLTEAMRGCASTTLACATMEAPHERAERLARRDATRRDAIENAVLDREAAEHNRDRSETLTEALARIAGKGARDDG